MRNQAKKKKPRRLPFEEQIFWFWNELVDFCEWMLAK
jgi:hypothetical protein